MLGQAIGGANDVVTLCHRAVLVVTGLKTLGDRVVLLLRMQQVRHRALDRLVVLGERPIGHHAERNEQTAHTLRIHDEGPHVVFGRGIGFEIRYVVPDPLLRRFAPPHLRAIAVPRLTVQIARRAVVKHATVRWPRPRPVRIDAQPGRVVRATTLHHGSGLGPATAEDPVAAGGRTVVAKEGETWQLLSGLDGRLRGIVGDIGQRLAVDFF